MFSFISEIAFGHKSFHILTQLHGCLLCIPFGHLVFLHRRKEVIAKKKTKRLSEENQEPPTKKKKKTKKRRRSSSHSKKHKHRKHRGKHPILSHLLAD